MPFPGPSPLQQSTQGWIQPHQQDQERERGQEESLAHQEETRPRVLSALESLDNALLAMLEASDKFVRNKEQLQMALLGARRKACGRARVRTGTPRAASRGWPPLCPAWPA